MHAPDFWQRPEPGLAARLLAPLGTLYGFAGRVRGATTRSWRAPIPVVCVGNLTVGGAGKTPVARSLAERLTSAGIDVHMVSRGYGGALAGPVQVDLNDHDARAVGDEPLLLARSRPTWVARDRPAGIRAAIAAGAGAVVLDDGYQNPTFAKDVGLVVVDGARGFGNGRVMPAGPLRETIATGLARAAAVVIVGDDAARIEARVGTVPILRARLEPVGEGGGIAGRRVLAFAGIGHPEKFFATLRDLGCAVVAEHPFPDHHPFAAAEIDSLLAAADAAGAVAVTTEKDAVRLPPDAASRVAVVAVRLVWDDTAALDRVLAPVLVTATRR